MENSMSSKKQRHRHGHGDMTPHGIDDIALQEFTHLPTTFADQKNFGRKKMTFSDQILISREWSLILATKYELVAEGHILATNYKFGRGRSHFDDQKISWSRKIKNKLVVELATKSLVGKILISAMKKYVSHCINSVGDEKNLVG